MSDLKLSDGREVDIDLYQISMKEFRDWFFNAQVKDKIADIYMEKVTGIKDASDLPQPDYKLLLSKVFTKSQTPIPDPNSLSESSSTTEPGSTNQAG